MSTQINSMVDPAYIAKVTTRKAMVQANAEQTVNAISNVFAPLQPDFAARTESIANMEGSRKKQLAAFFELVSDVRAVAASHLPCAKGCSSCCYQRVTITALEADHIRQKTGFIPERILPGASMKPIEAFGPHTPCTFLTDAGDCSIYEARPFVCRNYATLDVDNPLCQLENMQLTAEKHPAATNVPLLTGGPLATLYQRIAKHDVQNDIRAFFPKRE